ncbi:MAG: hypothetical protein ACYT04_58965 [Nostoc sp.]
MIQARTNKDVEMKRAITSNSNTPCQQLTQDPNSIFRAAVRDNLK